jgi:small subunit ribosomal protein S9
MPETLVQSTGRRKSAVARVRLLNGSGNHKVNGRDLKEYFTSRVHQALILEPLKVANLSDSFDVVANIDGGGSSGQAGAIRLGIARAIIEMYPEKRQELKKGGFLTRDSREKESKKYGLKKSRKAPQYSKR